MTLMRARLIVILSIPQKMSMLTFYLLSALRYSSIFRKMRVQSIWLMGMFQDWLSFCTEN